MARFRTLTTPIDTSMPQGMLSPQVLGAHAQMERFLISEHTPVGVRTAKPCRVRSENRAFGSVSSRRCRTRCRTRTVRDGSGQPLRCGERREACFVACDLPCPA